MANLERECFVFYRSFFECLESLATEDKAAAYDVCRAICAYALDGTEPELTGALGAIFAVIRPNLDASRKKAENGSKGGKGASKPEATDEQAEAKDKQIEANDKQPEATDKQSEANGSKTEKGASNKNQDKGQGTRDKGQGIKNKGQGKSPQTPQGAEIDLPKYAPEFESFWSIYPRKLDKGNAFKKYKARLNDGYTPEELLQAAQAYAEECRTARTEEHFIKHPKTFLSEALPFLDYIRKAKQAAEPDITPEQLFAGWKQKTEDESGEDESEAAIVNPFAQYRRAENE